MPLKLNVGLSKKIGLPDYGSLGASCHVEVELDGTLIQQDLDTFQRHVRNAYVACAQAVNDELGRHAASPSRVHASANGGEHKSSGNGTNGANGSASHRASEKQLGYVRQLAGEIRGLGVRRLETLAQKMYQKPLADLSSLEASGLIDMLKEIKAGRIALGSALNGAAA